MKTPEKNLAKTAINALVAVGLAGTAIAPAFAQDYERATLNVTYSDLDLGTAQGQKVLDQRVEKAVRAACRTTSQTTGTRMMSQEAQQCLSKARADAKQQVAAALANEQQRGG